MQPITVLKNCIGVNMLSDPSRIRFDPEQGLTELALGINVDVDRNNFVHRRKGYSELTTGNYNSGWCDGAGAYCVKEETGYGVLHQVNANYSTTAIRTGLTANRPMSFARMGPYTFYANGFESGYVHEDSSNGLWTADEAYVGPLGFDSSEIATWTHTNQKPRGIHEVRRYPPPGNHVAVLSGFALIASGNGLFFSLPNHPFYWRWSVDWVQFEEDITMVLPVDDGVFVSDLNATYFLKGVDPQKWVRVKVTETTAVPYAVCPYRFDASRSPFLADRNFFSLVGLWWANPGKNGEPGGLTVGSENGRVFNITHDRIAVPWSNHGALALYDDQAIVTLES